MKPLQKQLLEKFVLIRENVKEIKDVQVKKEKLIGAAAEVGASYNGTIALNYKEILHHQLAFFQYDIDTLINYLRSDLQDPFDLETLKTESVDEFDKKYGTQTSSMIEQIELPELVSSDRIKYSARFHPSPVRIVKEVLQDLPNYNVHYADWTFIDIGAGLGRNLLLASQVGFKNIIGIEISSYLCEQARDNIKKYNAIESIKCNADIHCVDVLNYKFPAGNLVLYFWEPFRTEIQTKFIRNLENHVAQSSGNVVLVFLGKAFPGIITSRFFKQVGTRTNALQKNLGVTYFQTIQRA